MTDRSASSGRTLLLDACGVLVGEPTQPLFEQVAADTKLSSDDVANIFRVRFRDPLWSGRLAEQEFWVDFAAACGTAAAPDAWRAAIASAMVPLPAVDEIHRWGQQARLVLISNHRHEWLINRLDKLGIRSHFEELHISSLTGLVKPEALAFQRALGGNFRRDALYVDDKAANVDAARSHGVCAVVAGADNHWLTEVEVWLSS